MFLLNRQILCKFYNFISKVKVGCQLTRLHSDRYIQNVGIILCRTVEYHVEARTLGYFYESIIELAAIVMRGHLKEMY